MGRRKRCVWGTTAAACGALGRELRGDIFISRLPLHAAPEARSVRSVQSSYMQCHRFAQQRFARPAHERTCLKWKPHALHRKPMKTMKTMKINVQTMSFADNQLVTINRQERIRARTVSAQGEEGAMGHWFKRAKVEVPDSPTGRPVGGRAREHVPAVGEVTRLPLVAKKKSAGMYSCAPTEEVMKCLL